jgi:hypothetical protein
VIWAVSRSLKDYLDPIGEFTMAGVAIDGGERPLWVDGGPSFIGRAAVGGKPSLNYLVGEKHQIGRYLKTERFGGLKIHD